MDLRFRDSLRDRIARRLERFEPRPLDEPGRRPAAVAIVLVDDGRGDAAFLLTRRAASLRTHSRQWALPGGRADEGERAEQTALRELREELGLDLAADAVLGRLDDYPTRSNFRISPIVVWADDAGPIEPNPDEVESVHVVPLRDLDRPDVPILREIPESDRPVIAIPLCGTQIHAPTAAILFQLREVALRGRPTRVSHFEQPVFAWR